jgi:hypothetical protein
MGFMGFIGLGLGIFIVVILFRVIVSEQVRVEGVGVEGGPVGHDHLILEVL